MSYLVPVAFGSVLWLLPLWTLRAKNVRLGNFDQRGWPQGRNLALAILDVARALVGGSLLARGLAGAPAWPVDHAWINEVWLAVALLVALAAQAFYWSNEDYLFGPVPFALGAMAALVHPAVLGLAGLLAMGTALALRAWTGFFLGAGFGLIGVSFLVELQDWRRGLLLGIALLLVILLGPLSGRHFGGLRK